MDARDAMIAWTPLDRFEGATEGRVAVMPWPDYVRRSDAFAFTHGACETEWREASELGLAVLVLAQFNTMVVRDGIPVEEAHRAMLAIDQYRQRISPDIEGANG